jgi:Zn-dependent protease
MVYILLIPPLLLAIILHESAHGWVAEKLGDPTARDLGRITLNPIPHIDPIGTIILPVILILAQSSFLFGWAKPVPVNPYYFQNPRKGMLQVALAGPVTNMSLAFLFGLVFRFLHQFGLEEGFFLSLIIMVIWGVIINLVLAIFNLIPIPPLDGSKILMGILSEEKAEKFALIERYSFILIILLFTIGRPIIQLFVYPFVGLFTYLFTGESMFTLLRITNMF